MVRSVTGTRTHDGDRVVELTNLPPALAAQLVISPRGWRDGFPLAFELPLTPVAALAETLPPSLRALPGGEPVVDPVGAAGRHAAEVLHGSSFPAGFVNQAPFLADRVHAAFPQSGAPRITAVGGAASWVATAPFKNVYLCLDARDAEREALHGVPSGAGWHHIGDAGETILASLERGPMLVGFAAATPMSAPANGGFAYGLDRPTTYALLQAGQALTTPRGAFHWFAVHQPADPCVQIWLHRCEPDAGPPSMACAGD